MFVGGLGVGVTLRNAENFSKLREVHKSEKIKGKDNAFGAHCCITSSRKGVLGRKKRLSA